MLEWRPNSSIMKGRLARRTFVLLVLAALIPIVVATWFIVGHTDAYIDSKAHQSLTLEAKKYGLSLFQRLELAATALSAASAEQLATESQRADKRDNELLATLTPYFRSVQVLSPSGVAMNALDFAAAAQPGDALLRVIRDENGTNAVALMVADSSGGWRVGILKHEYLWQPAALPAELYVRVSDGDGKVLFASLPESGSAGQQATLEDGDRAHWELFLQQRFTGGKWLIDFIEPHSEIKLEFRRYKRNLLFTLVPLIGGLILFASVSIRRTHRPLEALTDATHRIARGDYAGRVLPIGDEEMRGLADAFNGMTEQIGRNFETLAVLSELDRHILRSADLEEIIYTVLRHARSMLPCDQCAVLIFDEDCSDIARMHVARSSEELVTYKARVQIGSAMRALLDSSANLLNVGAGHHAYAMVQELMTEWQHDRYFGVLPIRTDKAVQGAIVLACATSQAPPRAALDVAIGLSERMAVAISNADRQHALVRQAHYDALTGLPNRVLFKDRLAQRIAHCQRARSRFALLFIDLDRFKIINDSFGHTSGDELLKSVAARLTEELPTMDTIARLGGDEFTIITADVESAGDAANAAQAVLAALTRPVLLGDIEHFVSASIGIAVYPQDGVTTDVLLRNADVAMYRAKSAGSGRFAYYEEAMNREAMERVELESELRQALARDELSVVYQPRIDLRTGEIIGVEALSRWQHPRYGMVPPDRFIRVAEDSGLIIAIGDRVLREVCAQYNRWLEVGLDMQRLAYNVSVRQLQTPGFTQSIREIIERAGIPRGVLEIEITESVLATDLAYLTSVLGELHEMGVLVAIDDFGTGYSSLSYLRLLPIDALKIDRSFLPPPSESGSAALCEAIIAMSKALNVTPIAEGVECAEQVEFLLRNGCSIAQGFYFSRAVSAEEIAHRFGRAAAANIARTARLSGSR